jgi:hypothetical protein
MQSSIYHSILQVKHHRQPTNEEEEEKEYNDKKE